MRFKNFSRGLITVPFQVWTRPEKDGEIILSLNIESGDLTEDFDPADPMVQLMLKAHPELRPMVVLNAWEKILAGVL